MILHHFSRSSSERSLLLVAPANAKVQAFSGKLSRSHQKHSALISQIQRHRGRIYSEEGAIPTSSLTSDGRHQSPVDESSWHLLTIDSQRNVLGCIRFRQHQYSAVLQDLCLRESSQAKCDVWGTKLAASISADVSSARQLGFNYVEIGGWALSQQIRGTAEALQNVLAIFAWSKAMGGALGVSAATERNSSASILKRLGGGAMQWDGCALPPYYDHQYKCGMEILRFDSRQPNPRYADSIEALRRKMATIEVVQDAAPDVVYFPKLPFFIPELAPADWLATASPAF